MGLVMGRVLIEMCWADRWSGAAPTRSQVFYCDGCRSSGSQDVGQHTI